MSGKGIGRNPLNTVTDGEDATWMLHLVNLLLPAFDGWAGSEAFDAEKLLNDQGLAYANHCQAARMVAECDPESRGMHADLAEVLVDRAIQVIEAARDGFRLCQNCGDRYTAASAKAKYCGAGCKQAAYRFRELVRSCPDGRASAKLIYERLLRLGVPPQAAQRQAYALLTGRGWDPGPS